MITDGLISLPIAVLNFIIGLLPDYSGLPSGMTTAIEWGADLSEQVGSILPTDVIWTIILLVITIEIAILGFNTIAWLLHWKQAK